MVCGRCEQNWEGKESVYHQLSTQGKLKQIITNLDIGKYICINIWQDGRKLNIFQAMVELERAKNFDHGFAGVDDILPEHSKWYQTFTIYIKDGVQRKSLEKKQILKETDWLWVGGVLPKKVHFTLHLIGNARRKKIGKIGQVCGCPLKKLISSYRSTTALNIYMTVSLMNITIGETK